jgi:SOS-response transcriptional repressor LexA
MVYLRRVVGQSMLPTLRPGQVCVFVKARSYEHGDIVLAQAEGRPVVKRVHMADDEVHLKGDNHSATNTYTLGRRTRKNKIVAKMVWPRSNAASVPPATD